MITTYCREADRARTSYITVAMAQKELDRFSQLLNEFTSKNDDLKLINKRYR